MKHFLFLSLSLTLLAACNSKEKKSSTTKVGSPVTLPADLNSNDGKGTLSATTTKKVMLRDDFSNIEEFKANINTFSIRLEALAGHYSGANVECKKELFDGSANFTSTEFDSSGQVANIDLVLSDSDPVVVDYECLVLDGETEIDSTSIRLKKSFIVTGEQNMTIIGASEIETLFLEEGSSLSTNGAPEVLSMNTLISNNAKIITFSADKVDANRINKPGAGGGKIKLSSNTARGVLEVELRGLSGGKMTRIPDKNSTIPPQDPTTNGCIIINPSKPTNCSGKQGPVGYQGRQGYQGAKGGDSGSLDLNIADGADFKISVKHFPGKGSQGGVGGEGGDGGPGGLGGSITYQESRSTPMVKRFPSGPQGNQGPQGTMGPAGYDGQISISKILIQDQNVDYPIKADWTNFQE